MRFFARYFGRTQNTSQDMGRNAAQERRHYKRTSSPSRFAPRLESLEDRCVPSVSGNGLSDNVALSPNGQYAAFRSLATDLTPTPGIPQESTPSMAFVPGSVYLENLQTHSVTLVQPEGRRVFSDLTEKLQVTNDGRYVLFSSIQDSPVPGKAEWFIKDTVTGTKTAIAPDKGCVFLAGDGRVFYQDKDPATGGKYLGIFVKDLHTGLTRKLVGGTPSFQTGTGGVNSLITGGKESGDSWRAG